MTSIAGLPFHYAGTLLLSRGRTQAAEKAFRLSIRVDRKNDRAHAALAALLLKRKAYREALSYFNTATALARDRASLHDGRGRCLLALKQDEKALLAFQTAIHLAPANPRYRLSLADLLRRKNRTWQEIEQLEIAAKGLPTDVKISERLGSALIEMGRWSDALDELKRLFTMRVGLAEYQYQVGLCHQRLGQTDQAARHYETAVLLDTRLNASVFGIGAFHEAAKHWILAIDAFTQTMRRNPSPALSYRLGRAHERNYQWSKAAENYEIALSGDSSDASRNYRLAFVYERMGLWAKSASRYAAALALSDTKVSWRYRWAYALRRAGRVELAAVVFFGIKPGSLSMFNAFPGGIPDHAVEGLEAKRRKHEAGLVGHQSEPAPHYKFACFLAQIGDYAACATALRNAIDRSSEHHSDWHLMLGAALYRLGQFGAACDAFEESRIVQRALGIDTAKSQEDKNLRLVADYVEMWETLPIREDVILYESNLGGLPSCNPHALFQALLDDPRHKNSLHVWALTDPARAPLHMKALANVAFVKKDSLGYRRHLATAKYLINNSTFPAYFIRRQEQRYLNTWHGTPLKAMGKDIRIPTEFMSHNNTARNLLHATHVISPNPHTSRVLIDRNDISGIFSGKLAETGYPRIDRTLAVTDERKAAIRSSLGLDARRPVVVYLPTWRGSMDGVEVDHARLISDVSALSDEFQLVFRGHHFAEKALGKMKAAITIAPSDLDTYDLLAVADALITDYSSVFFDYLATRKPIIFYAYDREEYEQSRGRFYFDMESLPGPVCSTLAQTIEATRRSVTEKGYLDPRHEAALQEFARMDDGHATARALAFFMDDDDSCLVTDYPASSENLLLFPGPLTPNGITSSFMNLIRDLDGTGVNAAIVVAPSSIQNHEANRANFEALPDGVHKLGRVGRFANSYEDIWVRARVEETHSTPSEALMNAYLKSGEREFRRLFGDSTWRARVVFDGYGTMWPSILVGGENDPGTSLVYLHNDMLEERFLRFPALHSLFNLYRRFDQLVSVSETMADTNRAKLAVPYAIDPARFVSTPNLIDPHSIRELAAAPLDSDIAGFLEGKRSFINIARLSPEKDQLKLIKAFKLVSADHPDCCLLLVGDGPHRNRIEHAIRKAKLGSKVMLAGQRSNPFPALLRADCFVLSSNHEGQPMVLLESLTLGKRIIATNIDGNRGVLADRHGLLVENSVKGLASGMARHLRGQVVETVFDADAYRDHALQSFLSLMHAGPAARLDDQGPIPRQAVA